MYDSAGSLIQALADLVAAYAVSTDVEMMQANKKLMDSGRSGHVAAAIQALDEDTDIDYTDIFCNAMMATGSTTLCEAAYHGNIALVQELIARGAQFPIDTAHNQNPLCDAASKGHNIKTLHHILSCRRRTLNSDTKN